jgi:hypothetical protein
MKTHREYIDEQIRKKPAFAHDLADAEKDVAIAVELAKLPHHGEADWLPSAHLLARDPTVGTESNGVVSRTWSDGM